MSVVVAIKEGKKVYIGADSQSTKGNTRTTLRNPNNFKIWKVVDSNNCLMVSISAANDIYVDYPIALADTESTQFEVITEEFDDASAKKKKKQNVQRTEKD